jgi:hypothetical protein
LGFKDAFDSIEKYEIVSNGITKYTQNYAPEESFITNAACLDTIRKGDVFSKARHKDIFTNRYKDKCGCVLDWGINGSNRLSKTVTIKLKIDIRRFLPLSNVKYLPAFAGKIELHVQFGTAGLVWCPISPVEAWKYESPPNYWGGFAQEAITTEFMPIGVAGFGTVSATLPTFDNTTGLIKTMGVTKADELTVSVVPSSLEIRRLDSVIYCFGIKHFIRA